MKSKKPILNSCSIYPIGTYCELNKLEPVSELEYGMDFRKPEYRLEVFLRFYEFHLKYRSHAGAVYFMLPYLQDKFKLTKEQMLWITFINGITQNIITTWIIFEQFPKFTSDPHKIQNFINKNWKSLGWDMDRRYVKAKFNEALLSYQKLIGRKTQEEYWENICKTESLYDNFNLSWNEVMNKFNHFGRLSTFSYLEYLKIIGINLDCNSLFLDDMNGSKSHRNGMVKVLGRDEMDCHDKLNPDFQGYNKNHINWIQQEADNLLQLSKQRFKNSSFINDVSYFTLETTLCCYKSWHRANRRYPNVYMDMFYDRIKKAETYNPKKDFGLFWKAREKYLPKELRVEDNEWDLALNPIKQNFYLNTGQVIMMDSEWDCFKNDYKQTLKMFKK